MAVAVVSNIEWMWRPVECGANAPGRSKVFLPVHYAVGDELLHGENALRLPATGGLFDLSFKQNIPTYTYASGRLKVVF